MTDTSDKWQPIETAPQDGEFLVYDGIGVLKAGASAIDGDIMIGECDGDHGHKADFNPTHWHPLPAPPTEHDNVEPIAPGVQNFLAGGK